MPYWRLSGFYFFYFATLGALVPYWAPYLRSIGFEASEIGNLVALILATKIVAPNVWAWIADHSDRTMGVVRLATLLTVVCFTGVFFGTGFWWMALVMSAFSFFWNAALPQLEATTMNYLGSRPQHYGRVRLWGSIGFIVAVWSLGPVLDRYGEGTIRPVIMVLMVGIWLASMSIPNVSSPQKRGTGPGVLEQIFRRRDVVALLLACFLMQASHAPYYTFYTIYLTDNGYSNTVVGSLWALGVICEVVVFLAMPRLLGRVGLRAVLLSSFALAGLRWVLIAGFVDSPAVLAFAQTLHAVTYGAYHAAAIHMVHRMFTGRLQHRGQALYSSMSFGVGGALGSLYSGYAWTWLGPSQTYLLAAGLTVLAFGLAYRLIPSRI
jgi:PPP family 3-phenylpropionic acid transporter